MFKCQVCEVLKKENDYLKQMINRLHEKLNIPILEEPGIQEDFVEEPPADVNKDGFEPPEVHDD